MHLFTNYGKSGTGYIRVKTIREYHNKYYTYNWFDFKWNFILVGEHKINICTGLSIQSSKICNNVHN